VCRRLIPNHILVPVRIEIARRERQRRSLRRVGRARELNGDLVPVFELEPRSIASGGSNGDRLRQAFDSFGICYPGRCLDRRIDLRVRLGGKKGTAARLTPDSSSNAENPNASSGECFALAAPRRAERLSRPRVVRLRRRRCLHGSADTFVPPRMGRELSEIASRHRVLSNRTRESRYRRERCHARDHRLDEPVTLAEGRAGRGKWWLDGRRFLGRLLRVSQPFSPPAICAGECMRPRKVRPNTRAIIASWRRDRKSVF